MTRNPTPAAEAIALDPASLFRSLAGRGGLILAVSGGGDPTALMLLVSRWLERPPVLVVSVDHGLRPEAAGEARLAAQNAERLKLPWRIMQAAGPQNGNLQDWARRARYACLVTAAREAHFDTIVTAHHQGDQAETFLLRLARGSGVYGLTAMREEESLDGVALARPLLAVPRDALSSLVVEAGLPTVDDPSNVDARFDRVRMRALLPTLTEHGLGATRLAETAGRLGRAAEALDHYAGAFLAEHFAADRFGVVSGPSAPLATVPEEVGLRALARVLQAAGGADYTPPLTSVKSLYDALLTKRSGGTLKRTLAGVVIGVAGERLAISREWGRDGVADAAAPAGFQLLWDGRFRLEIPCRGGSLSIGALGRAKRRLRCAGAPPGSVETLPGLYQDGTLVAAPRGVLAANDGEPLDILAAECIVGQRLGLSGDQRPAGR